eukprot:2968607-Rhodomonas_salina.1
MKPAPAPPRRSQSLSHSPLTCKIPSCVACEQLYRGDVHREGHREGHAAYPVQSEAYTHTSSFVQIPKDPLPKKIPKHAGGYAGDPQAPHHVSQVDEVTEAVRDYLHSASARSSAVATYAPNSDSDSEEDPSAEDVLRTFIAAYTASSTQNPQVQMLQRHTASMESLEYESHVRRPTIAEEKAFFEMQRQEERRLKHLDEKEQARSRKNKKPSPKKHPSVLSAARAHVIDDAANKKPSVRAQGNDNSAHKRPSVLSAARAHIIEDSAKQVQGPLSSRRGNRVLEDPQETFNSRSAQKWRDSDALIPRTPGVIERLSQFADFGNGWGDVSTVQPASQEEIVLHSEPSLKGRATLTWWSLLTLEEKATGLLSMPVQSRFELFDAISRKEFAEALGRGMARDTKKDVSVLLDLDPEDRAEILTHLTISQRGRALAAMQYDDRMKTIRYMHHDHVGPALVNMSHAELLKTFKGLDERIRPAVFTALPASEKTAVLTWTPAHARAVLLAKMDSTELSNLLQSLPVKECCSTLKAMHSTLLATNIMDLILEMPQETRDKI